jgi:hypothetical protein
MITDANHIRTVIPAWHLATGNLTPRFCTLCCMHAFAFNNKTSRIVLRTTVLYLHPTCRKTSPPQSIPSSSSYRFETTTTSPSPLETITNPKSNERHTDSFCRKAYRLIDYFKILPVVFPLKLVLKQA